MKPSTLEWVEKAESDYQLALALSRRRKVKGSPKLTADGIAAFKKARPDVKVDN